jgi:alpha-acetolactate decarboxylase
MGHENDGFGTIVDGILDRRQSTNDSLVVGDLGVGLLVEWDVEVDLCMDDNQFNCCQNIDQSSRS